MTRWSGDLDPANPDPGHDGMFVVDPGTGDVSLPVRYWDGFNPHPCTPNTDNWPANGNNPTTSAIPNRGNYWVTAMAVDPDTGYCWYSFAGEAGYNFGYREHILVRGVNQWELYDLGEVATNTDIYGLAFGGGKAYALTANRGTGAYELYSITPPADYTQQASIQQLKNSPRGFMTTIGNERNAIVTFADSYAKIAYVEDVNDSGTPVSGIKIVPGNDGVTFPSVGDQARPLRDAHRP